MANRKNDRQGRSQQSGRNDARQDDRQNQDWEGDYESGRGMNRQGSQFGRGMEGYGMNQGDNRGYGQQSSYVGGYGQSDWERGGQGPDQGGPSDWGRGEQRGFYQGNYGQMDRGGEQDLGQGDYGRGNYSQMNRGRRGQPGYSQGNYGQGGYGQADWGDTDEQGYWNQGLQGQAPYRGSSLGRGESGQYSSGQSYGQTDWGRGQQQQRQTGPYAGKGPQGYKRSDDRIKEDISEQLMQNGYLDASEISVQVKDGEVTLTGSVDSRQAKRMAEDIAEECSGVQDVQNQLRVRKENGNNGGQSQGERAGAQSKR